MWVATQFGFFSIVQKDGTYHVRARSMRDLEALLVKAGLGRRGPIHTKDDGWQHVSTDLTCKVLLTEQGDYPIRALVSKKQLARIFAALAKDIDYPNFKARVAERQDQRDKLYAYHQLWANLAILPREPGLLGTKKRYSWEKP